MGIHDRSKTSSEYLKYPGLMKSVFVKHIAIPSDHGSWVFLLSPLLIGLFTAPNWSIATCILITAAFAGFLIRQPTTIAVKTISGRRPKRELKTAIFWIIVYGIFGFISILGLIILGYSYILLLVVPGIIVFTWHLYLVSKRNERGKLGIEIVASGVLALAAPAGYWVGVGYPESIGWLLFFLVWLQSAASIVYAHLRLDQRRWDAEPDLKYKLYFARRAFIYTTFNFLLVLIFSISGLLPRFLFIPYAVQWIETIWGALNPAIGAKPNAIGIRQLVLSSLFTILFIITWNLG